MSPNIGMLKESKKEESSKVYCSLCKHFFPKSKGLGTINTRGELDRAEHDECRRELFTCDTPIRPENYYPNPIDLNYNNHCPLYEELSSSPVCKYCGELVKMVHTVKFGLLRVCVNPKCRGEYRDQEDNVFYDGSVDRWFLIEEKDSIANNFKPCGCPINGLYGCSECMDVQTFNYEEEEFDGASSFPIIKLEMPYFDCQGREWVLKETNAHLGAGGSDIERSAGC